MQTYNPRLFIDQSYFINDASRNVIIFQPIYNIFKRPAGLVDTIVEWQSKGLSNEKIGYPIASNYILFPKRI